MNNMTGRLEKEIRFYQKIENKLKNLPSIFNEYYVSMRANRKSYTTIDRYIEHVLHFAKFVTNDNLTEYFYKNINPSNIESYMISLETRQTKNGIQKTGDSILQTRWSSLNNFFEWLMKKGYISENPVNAVERPKNNTQHKVTYLTKVEINKLLRAVDKNPNVSGIRDKTLIRLAIATGLRVSALVNLNIEDVDFENGVLRVIEKRQKVREIDIGKNTQEILKEWIDIRNESYPNADTSALFLNKFSCRFTPKAANEMLEKYCNESNIKNITFHKLRATAACLLAKNGIPLKTIAKQLGHNSTATTQIYLDAFEEDNQRAVDVLDSTI